MTEQLLARDSTEVEAVVREAAAAEILPRFRQLAAHEIAEKSGPHDLVTVADRGAEEHLTAALTTLLPGSVVVGEEAVAADPSSYEAIRGDAPVWIVDPVDGTRQFVRGEPGFCTLVALAHHGELLASWTYAAALDEMAVAVRGGGARLNGKPLLAGSCGTWRGAPSGHLAPGLHHPRAEERAARPPYRRHPRQTVRLGGPGVSGRRPGNPRRGRVQLGTRLGPRGRTAARGGGRAAPI